MKTPSGDHSTPPSKSDYDLDDDLDKDLNGDTLREECGVFGIFGHPGINHHPEVVSGVLEEDCKALLQDFFRKRRVEHTAAASEDASSN